MIKASLRALAFASLFLALSAVPAEPCSVVQIGPQPTPNDWVRSADAIVRARAVDYSTPPACRPRCMNGLDSVVQFKVLEILKGEGVAEDVQLLGRLTDYDDFNDGPPPYNFVRPDGRTGSCFATSYRKGAEFLLMLQRDAGTFTVYWGFLAPLNEQLRTADDPWLLWVRQEVNKK